MHTRTDFGQSNSSCTHTGCLGAPRVPVFGRVAFDGAFYYYFYYFTGSLNGLTLHARKLP